MKPSLIHPVHAAQQQAASAAMTILATIPARRRTDVLAGHVYAVPVVRELPRPPAELVGDRCW
ncbi:MAG: hypothetical protein ACRDK0_12530 [Solirubrobacteraceae bacterium]